MTNFLRAHALALTLLGVAFFFGSAGLTAAHVLRIRAMRDIGFPIAAEVQPLQQRKSMLQEQSEVATLQASARGDAYREIYALYVLPETPDVPRTLAILEQLLTQLQERGSIRSIDSLETGERAEITIAVTTEQDGGSALLDLLELSGVLTVNDAFTDSERRSLIALTERENPAVIAALEQFLSADLLQYARTPQIAESQLLKSVGSELFEADFHALVDGSRLRFFAQTALLLDREEDSLWPLPLFTVERAHAELTDGIERLTVTVRAHSAGESAE